MSLKKEYGDFQTPIALARRVVAIVGQKRKHYSTIIEPTCGAGSLLAAAVERYGGSAKYIGFDINPDHVETAKTSLVRAGACDASVEQRDFYNNDWKRLISEQVKPVLVIGNPPWITNAAMGVINGKNLPDKSNYQKRRGVEAITGKSNFDISESMLTELAEALHSHDGTLAMLVKTVVARKLLIHCWAAGLLIDHASVHRVDAAEHFNAAVDASLIIIEFGRSIKPKRATVYKQLSRAVQPTATLAFEDGVIIANLDAYCATKYLCGGSTLRWRSGIKHDCSKIMELEIVGRQLRNGLGEQLDLEAEYIMPMFKTSEVAGGRVDRCHRRMVVTQRRVGQRTDVIAERAPKTWSYLQRHRALFSKRRSSIYRNKPDFSIFGVGDYTFSPWKIAVSGMYKGLNFVKVGPFDSKPVVFDDTTNFVPCPSEAAASLLLSLLDSNEARTFYEAFVFWDAKRPITVDLLGRLNILALADSLGMSGAFAELFRSEFTKLRRVDGSITMASEPTLWS